VVDVVRVVPLEDSRLEQMWWGACAIEYERHDSLSCRLGWVSFKYWASAGRRIATDGGSNAGASTMMQCTVAVACSSCTVVRLGRAKGAVVFIKMVHGGSTKVC
jgi:hypothetical protein